MKRRNFLSMLAAAAATPLILLPHRKIFLPPPCGWIAPIASLAAPSGEYEWYDPLPSFLESYADGLKSGKFSFDQRELHMWWSDGVENDGLFHSKFTGNTYDFFKVDASGWRARIDDGCVHPRIYVPERIQEVVKLLPDDDAELNAAQAASRKLAAERAAVIRSRANV